MPILAFPTPLVTAVRLPLVTQQQLPGSGYLVTVRTGFEVARHGGKRLPRPDHVDRQSTESRQRCGHGLGDTASGACSCLLQPIGIVPAAFHVKGSRGATARFAFILKRHIAFRCGVTVRPNSSCSQSAGSMSTARTRIGKSFLTVTSPRAASAGLAAHHRWCRLRKGPGFTTSMSKHLPGIS